MLLPNFKSSFGRWNNFHQEDHKAVQYNCNSAISNYFDATHCKARENHSSPGTFLHSPGSASQNHEKIYCNYVWVMYFSFFLQLLRCSYIFKFTARLNFFTSLFQRLLSSPTLFLSRALASVSKKAIILYMPTRRSTLFFGRFLQWPSHQNHCKG